MKDNETFVIWYEAAKKLHKDLGGSRIVLYLIGVGLGGQFLVEYIGRLTYAKMIGELSVTRRSSIYRLHVIQSTAITARTSMPCNSRTFH
jgi:hypothetical protein